MSTRAQSQQALARCKHLLRASHLLTHTTPHLARHYMRQVLRTAHDHEIGLDQPLASVCCTNCGALYQSAMRFDSTTSPPTCDASSDVTSSSAPLMSVRVVSKQVG